MRIIVFDASTTCTGCAICEIRDKVVTGIKTIPIIPSDADPAKLGYLRTKVKTEFGLAWVRTKDEKLSKTAVEKRNREVKVANSTARMASVIDGINSVIRDNLPLQAIIMEQNMSFGRNDVTKLLAEVAGAIQATAQFLQISFEKIPVQTARAHHDVVGSIKELVKLYTPAQLKKMDQTKVILKHKMLTAFSKYDLNVNMTLDESDALVILYHWLVSNECIF